MANLTFYNNESLKKAENVIYNTIREHIKDTSVISDIEEKNDFMHYLEKKDYCFSSFILYKLNADCHDNIFHELLFLSELYSYAIENIFKSYSQDLKKSARDNHSQAEYLLFSDGLISYIIKREFSILLASLPDDKIKSILQKNNRIHNKAIMIKEKEIPKQNYILCKLIFYLVIISYGSISDRAIDHFIELYNDMDLKEDEIIFLNKLYKYLILSEIIKNNKEQTL